MEYLCAQGANQDLAKHDGTTPVYVAAQEGHLAVVQFLCEQGADWHTKPEGGLSALALAKIKGHLEIAAYLAGLPGVTSGLVGVGMFSSA